MAAPIPDGTLCMIVRTLPEYRCYIGHCVVVTYDPVASNVMKQNFYRMSPEKLDLQSGKPLYGEDKCLMPIPPKDDDAETRNTEVPKEVPA